MPASATRWWTAATRCYSRAPANWCNACRLRATICVCQRQLTKLDRFDLLILDDLSYVRRDQAETSVLFELIAERYERKSIAITANAPFSAWEEVFPDKAMTLAAVDRLVHHATILEINVDSYRRRVASPARRQRSATQPLAPDRTAQDS